MNLVTLLTFCLVVTTATAFYDRPEVDRNFRLAHTFSGILEQSQFARVIGESFRCITNRTYEFNNKQRQYFSYPLDIQCLLTAYEILSKTPLKLKPEVMEMLANMESKTDCNSTTDSDNFLSSYAKHLREDYKRLDSHLLKGIEHAKKTVTTVSSDAHKAVFKKVISYLEQLQNITKESNDDLSLGKTVLSLYKVVLHLPTLTQIEKGLCPLSGNVTLLHRTGPLLALTREQFIFNFRRTVTFVREAMFNRLLKASGWHEALDKYISMFSGVISDKALSTIKTLIPSYGQLMIQDLLTLQLEVHLRPEGYIRTLADFHQGVRNFESFAHKLPKELQCKSVNMSMAMSCDAKKLVASLQKPGQIYKMCMGHYNHYPEAIRSKLQAKKGYKEALNALCKSQERTQRIFEKMAHKFRSMVTATLSHLGVRPCVFAMIRRALAPGTVYPASYNVRNPVKQHPELASKETMKKHVMPMAHKIGAAFFPNVTNVEDRLVHLVEVMYGKPACKL